MWMLLLTTLLWLGTAVGSDDPVAADCEPLCRYELEAETQCAREQGCYSPSIRDNDALFIQCWQPCWRSSSSNCLSVCRQQHGAIKARCSQECAGSQDDFCPGFCFALTLDTLVHGTGTPKTAVGPPGSQPDDTVTPVTPTPQSE